jgi:hypothetical protein
MADQHVLIRAARRDDNERVWPLTRAFASSFRPERAAFDASCRRLMERAEEWARSTGAAYLALASRRAGSFYLALDYEDSAVYYKKTLA